MRTFGRASSFHSIVSPSTKTKKIDAHPNSKQLIKISVEKTTNEKAAKVILCYHPSRFDSRKSLIVFSKLENSMKVIKIIRKIPTSSFHKDMHLAYNIKLYSSLKKTYSVSVKLIINSTNLYGYISAPSFTSQHYLKYFKSFIHNIKNKATQDNNGNVNVETETDLMNGNGKFCCQQESTGKIRITENPLPDSIC